MIEVERKENNMYILPIMVGFGILALVLGSAKVAMYLEDTLFIDKKESSAVPKDKDKEDNIQ